MLVANFPWVKQKSVQRATLLYTHSFLVMICLLFLRWLKSPKSLWCPFCVGQHHPHWFHRPGKPQETDTAGPSPWGPGQLHAEDMLLPGLASPSHTFTRCLWEPTERLWYNLITDLLQSESIDGLFSECACYFDISWQKHQMAVQ